MSEPQEIVPAHSVTEADTLASRVQELEKALRKAETALKPLSDAVYNDNGDMTVILPVVSYEQCQTAYFASKAIDAALTAKEA